jgi:anti-sigma factor RsiW
MTHPVQNGDNGSAPIDCEVAVRRLWDYLDGRLPEMARAEVEAHLASCASCPPHFAFARTIQRALASSAPPVVQTEEDRLRERVRAALRRLTDDGPTYG